MAADTEIPSIQGEKHICDYYHCWDETIAGLPSAQGDQVFAEEGSRDLGPNRPQLIERLAQ